MQDAPFDPFVITGPIQRFDGPAGWFYLPLPADDDAALRPVVTSQWPALMKVQARIGDTAWTASVMPIKDGPLFIALPARIRKRIGIGEGDDVSVQVDPDDTAT